MLYSVPIVRVQIRLSPLGRDEESQFDHTFPYWIRRMPCKKSPPHSIALCNCMLSRTCINFKWIKMRIRKRLTSLFLSLVHTPITRASHIFHYLYLDCSRNSFEKKQKCLHLIWLFYMGRNEMCHNPLACMWTARAHTHTARPSHSLINDKTLINIIYQ